MFREVLAESLTRRGLDVVAEISDAHAALAVVEEHRPDIVLMDLLLSGSGSANQGPDGIELTERLCRINPTTAVLILTCLSDPAYASRAFRSGARGYALKTQTADELVGALRQIDSGRRYLAPALAPHVGAGADAHDPPASDGLERLSAREREIFDLVVSGSSNKEIASRLFISVKTVETHRGRINPKVKAHSTADLMLVAFRRGLLV